MTDFEPISRQMLLDQGVCCGEGCTNCPYNPRFTAGTTDTFECKPSGCWCEKLPKVMPIESDKCMSPIELKEAIAQSSKDIKEGLIRQSTDNPL